MHKNRKNIEDCQPLSLRMGETYQDAFKTLIRALSNKVKTATPDPDKRLCLFANTLTSYWAGMLTQLPWNDFTSTTLAPQECDYGPVSFVSGTLRELSYRCSTPEQEFYALIARVSRLQRILAICGELYLFTNHKNIFYMLSPSRFNAYTARHVAHKTQRWTIRF